jgi:hypothetical protein
VGRIRRQRREIIFYTYIEVLDNDILYSPIVDTKGTLDWNAYKRDQVVMRLGSYSVNFVTGSTNRLAGPGSDNPDYTLAFVPTTLDETFWRHVRWLILNSISPLGG